MTCKNNNKYILQNVIEEKNGNIILSPISVQTAIGLIMMGARGSTEKEIINGLKFSDQSCSHIANGFDQFLQPLENNPFLKIVNKVYAMQGFNVKQEFHEIATKQFKSGTQSLDFRNADASASSINKWVEEQTNNLIKDLIPSNSLSELTRMVLVNAIYFKGLWEYPFLKKNTDKQPFYTNETNAVPMDTMHIKVKPLKKIIVFNIII